MSDSTLFYILYAVLTEPMPFYWSCPPQFTSSIWGKEEWGKFSWQARTVLKSLLVSHPCQERQLFDVWEGWDAQTSVERLPFVLFWSLLRWFSDLSERKN